MADITYDVVEAATIWRNRIVEIKMVSAEELKANPLNWRLHPLQQQEALAGVLEEVGIADTLRAYYSEEAGGALTLIDGHLRQEMGGLWPVAILDVTDEEARYLLATLHPTGDLAQVDTPRLSTLLSNLRMENVAVRQMLIDFGKKQGVEGGDVSVSLKGETSEFADSAQFDEEGWQVTIKLPSPLINDDFFKDRLSEFCGEFSLTYKIGR